MKLYGIFDGDTITDISCNLEDFKEYGFTVENAVAKAKDLL